MKPVITALLYVLPFYSLSTVPPSKRELPSRSFERHSCCFYVPKNKEANGLIHSGRRPLMTTCSSLSGEPATPVSAAKGAIARVECLIIYHTPSATPLLSHIPLRWESIVKRTGVGLSSLFIIRAFPCFQESALSRQMQA